MDASGAALEKTVTAITMTKVLQVEKEEMTPTKAVLSDI